MRFGLRGPSSSPRLDAARETGAFGPQEGSRVRAHNSNVVVSPIRGFCGVFGLWKPSLGSGTVKNDSGRTAGPGPWGSCQRLRGSRIEQIAGWEFWGNQSSRFFSSFAWLYPAGLSGTRRYPLRPRIPPALLGSACGSPPGRHPGSALSLSRWPPTRPPITAHPSHVSWPHGEPHPRPQWGWPHASPPPITAHRAPLTRFVAS